MGGEKQLCRRNNVYGMSVNLTQKHHMLQLRDIFAYISYQIAKKLFIRDSP